MTTLDPIFRKLARQLIDQFGKDIVLTRTQDTFNPTTNKRTAGAVTTFNLKSSPPRAPTLEEVDENQAQRGDMFVVIADEAANGSNIAALPYDINTDSFAIDGSNYRLVAFKPIYSGEQTAAHELQLRG